METTEKTTSRVDSAGDVLSGKLKDLLTKKENVVIQVESDCIIAESTREVVFSVISIFPPELKLINQH
jgi:hypothetical protein